jgi:uncharacterized protein (TIGR03435 family)
MTAHDLSPLANHLWQSTLCVAVAWLLTLSLRKNHAAARYWVWMAASAKFLIPFSLLVSAGGHLGWRTVPAIVQPQFSLAMEEISQPFAAPAPMPLPRVGAPVVNPAPATLFGVWLCGIAIGVVFWVRRWRRIQSIRRTATPLDLNLPIRVMSASGRLEPGVVGIFRPALLLPEDILGRLTPAQLEAILAHELRHVQRRDNLTAAIHMLVETIFWFHPATWWIRARLIEERERACDEEVVQMGREPQVYAESILKVCEFYVASPDHCVSGMTGAGLKRRIEDIMMNRHVRNLGFREKFLLSAAALAAIGAPIFVGVMTAPPGHARPQVQHASAPATAQLIGQVADLAPSQLSRPPVSPTPPEDPLPGESTPAPVAAQTGSAAAPPKSAAIEFEAATVKVNRSGDTAPSRDIRGGTIYLRNVTLRMLLIGVYHIVAEQMSGAPGWFDSDRFDVAAKAPADTKGEDREIMLQNLLKRSFNLVVHKEEKLLPGYALLVSKSGPKLRESVAGQLTCTTGNEPTLHLSCRHAATKDIADVLTKVAQDYLNGGTVIDNTGLGGTWEFDLDWVGARFYDAMTSPLEGAPGPPPGMVVTSFFQAIQDQLGLRLESKKISTPILVIDHVDRVPTEN